MFPGTTSGVATSFRSGRAGYEHCIACATLVTRVVSPAQPGYPTIHGTTSVGNYVVKPLEVSVAQQQPNDSFATICADC
jgi:hypothetical protein